MNEYQRRAKMAVNEMLKLGFSQKDIAELVGVHWTTISHINALREESGAEFYVSERLMHDLERQTFECCRLRCEEVLSRLAVTVLDTCHDSGVVVNEEFRAEIRLSLVTSLSNALVPGAAPTPLPAGVAGVLASLGDDLYIVKLYPRAGGEGRSDENEATFRLLLAHELEHLARRLRHGAPRSGRPRAYKSAF